MPLGEHRKPALPFYDEHATLPLFGSRQQPYSNLRPQQPGQFLNDFLTQWPSTPFIQSNLMRRCFVPFKHPRLVVCELVIDRIKVRLVIQSK
jgi:hypothetical protein